VIAGFSATHAVHYTNGYLVEITNTLTYTGSLSSLGWQVTLPSGWSFVSNAGSLGQVQPSEGSTDTLGWGYITVPASPITFTYVVNVPYGATGSQVLAGQKVLAGQIFFSVGTGGQQSILATPNPLTVNLGIFHSADESHTGSLNLSDLTRVIELYNTHSGSVRTGCYLTDEASEDGFNPDTSRSTTAPFALPYYHSADENQVGNINLSELTRVIELYNYHAGSSRTGQYSVAVGTEDGFQPGP
jgi:hypothetical protein